MIRPVCHRRYENRSFNPSVIALMVCVFLIAVERPSFATDADQVAAVLKGEGVTIGAGDGSSFDKAIIVSCGSSIERIPSRLQIHRASIPMVSNQQRIETNEHMGDFKKAYSFLLASRRTSRSHEFP